MTHFDKASYTGTSKTIRTRHRGGDLSPGKSTRKIFILGKSNSIDQFSCATPVPVAHKLEGKTRIAGERVNF